MDEAAKKALVEQLSKILNNGLGMLGVVQPPAPIGFVLSVAFSDGSQEVVVQLHQEVPDREKRGHSDDAGGGRELDLGRRRALVVSFTIATGVIAGRAGQVVRAQATPPRLFAGRKLVAIESENGATAIQQIIIDGVPLFPTAKYPWWLRLVAWARRRELPRMRIRTAAFSPNAPICDALFLPPCPADRLIEIEVVFYRDGWWRGELSSPDIVEDRRYVYCKFCHKNHSVRRDEKPCAENAWIDE